MKYRGEGNNKVRNPSLEKRRFIGCGEEVDARILADGGESERFLFDTKILVVRVPKLLIRHCMIIIPRLDG